MKAFETDEETMKQTLKNVKVLTTPLLSTISWIIRPFFPITLPTRFRGTCKDSSLYSNIVLAFFTASLVCKVINHSFRIKLKLQFCLQTFYYLRRSYLHQILHQKVIPNVIWHKSLYTQDIYCICWKHVWKTATTSK